MSIHDRGTLVEKIPTTSDEESAEPAWDAFDPSEGFNPTEEVVEDHGVVAVGSGHRHY